MARLKQLHKNSTPKTENLSSSVLVDIPNIENNTTDIIYRIPTIDKNLNYSISCNDLESDEELFSKTGLIFRVSSVHSGIDKSSNIRTKLILSSVNTSSIEYHLVLNITSTEIQLPFKLKERYNLLQGKNQSTFELKLILDHNSFS